MGGFVEVYSKATGKKQVVPEHWLNHPVHGKGFAKTPSAKANEPGDGEPSDAWTRKQLDQHAAGIGIDTSALPNKGEVLAAIQAGPVADPLVVDTPVIDDNVTQNPDGTEPPAQTPAAGENQE